MQDPVNEVDVVGYGDGLVEVDSEGTACLAKKVTDRNGRVSFYVKESTRAVDRGMLFNRQSPTFNERKSDKEYSFVKVSAETFEEYLLFLKTTNPTHLRRAERART